MQGCIETVSIWKFLRERERERESRAGIWRELCRFFNKYIPDNAVILEIGAGYCEFINNAGRNAAKKIALDLNPDVEKFADRDVVIFNRDCLEVTSVMAESSVDVIFMSNFLEHLRSKEDIIRLFEGCRGILKNDGRLMLMHPNIRLTGGAYWDFFDHCMPLTEKSICEGLKMCGFEIRKCVPAFMPYTTKSSLPRHHLLVRAYLALPFMWRFFGKQSFIVAELSDDREE